ncbi:LexA family protein [Actinomadura sp. GTD37]|uniref:LexA family protein n=1 Tax=Actinomadura sp. GTD37 TaxID=1778030 RepID=UPI0035C19574
MTAELIEREAVAGSTITIPASRWAELVRERDRLRAEVAEWRAAQRLTPTQRVVLAAVRDYVAQHGCAPTMREIADLAGLNAATNAFHHLRALEREGFLRRDKHRARGIELVQKTEARRG